MEPYNTALDVTWSVNPNAAGYYLYWTDAGSVHLVNWPLATDQTGFVLGYLPNRAATSVCVVGFNGDLQLPMQTGLGNWACGKAS